MRTAAQRRRKRLSCGVIIVRKTRQGDRLLLLRAFANWDFPKGIKERGETPLEAAMREVVEETTLDDLEFSWGEQYVETGPYSRGKVARYYIARTCRSDVSLPINPEIGRPEHVEFRWVDMDEAQAMTTARLTPVIAWAIELLNTR